MVNKPEKIDVEQALSAKPVKAEGGSAEGEIQIVEVVGGETGEAPEPVVTRVAARPAGDAPSTEPFPGTVAGAAGEELAALMERLKRMAAEHENYRKRVERDRGEQKERANAELVLELLPVLDSFERALKGKAGALPAEFRSGVDLIHRQLLDTLMRAGLEPMRAQGQGFDPAVHDAVATTHDPQVPAGRVLEVFDGGYCFRGRLLRPARVRVSAAAGGGS